MTITPLPRRALITGAAALGLAASLPAVGTTPAFGNGTVSTANPKVLFVRTFSGAGAATNVPFNVIVVCGP